jgi:hypothetical protein
MRNAPLGVHSDFNFVSLNTLDPDPYLIYESHNIDDHLAKGEFEEVDFTDYMEGALDFKRELFESSFNTSEDHFSEYPSNEPLPLQK